MTKFHVFKDLDRIQEAASEIQIKLHNELNFDEEDEYVIDENELSDTDDVLEKNIYNPQPIVYYDEDG